MATYEINYLILQSRTENLDQIKDRVKKILENSGAKITETLEYKKRKLAYEINHESYGFYTVLRFELKKGEKIFTIKHELNLDGDIARYIVINAEELPELRQTMADKKQRETVKKEDLDKILSDKPETKEVKATKKKEVVEEKKSEKEEIVSEKKKEVKKSEKSEEIKPAKKADKEVIEEEKTDLEDLDKKLDEILDI